MFKNSVNAKDGVVVALDNKSPAGLNPRPKEIPRLQKWSDVVWLQFIRSGGKDLKWCFRSTVINEDTRNTVWEALRVSKHTAIPT